MLLLRRWRLTRKAILLTRATPDGALARITGTVVALGEPLVAPLSGESCVAVYSRFRPPGGAVGGGPPTYGRVDAVALVPFVIDAGELQATIVADTARFWIAKERLRSAERKSMFLTRHGMRTAYGRFREQLVRVGACVTVVGTVVLDGADRPVRDVGFRDSVASINLVGSAKHPIAIL